MSKEKWTSLVLIALVVFDASGDAFRAIGWQYLHHSLESTQIVFWFVLWAAFRFNPVYIVMYFLGRIWLFDIVVNLWRGDHLLYMGENDFFGAGVRWFADLVKQNYFHFSFMLKFLALTWWMAYFWTNKTFRQFKLL